MSHSSKTLHNEIIAELVRKAEKKLAPALAKQLADFIPRYYKNIPLEDFKKCSVDDLFGAVISHFGLLEQRKPHECKLRVYNPQLKKEGWESTHTIIDLAYDDMPFLVDSMRMEIISLGLTIHLTVSMGGLKAQRDSSGKLLKILPVDTQEKNVTSEALVHMEIVRETDPKMLQTIQDNLTRILQDVHLVVQDWQKMREKLFQALDELEKLEQNNIPIPHEEFEESKAFLHWLVDNHFTFLGYRDYEVIGEGEQKALKLISHTGLGVLSNESTSKVIRFFHELPPKALTLVLAPQFLILSKTNTKATVHRSAYTDYVGIKRYDAKGNIIGEHRFIGLYTTEAYHGDPLYIPYLRLKVDHILQKSGLPRKGHGARVLRNILSTIPRDDLIQGSVEELYELGMGILYLQERHVIRLFMRKDAYDRYISCLVFVPKENFSTDLLYRMRDLLMRGLGGTEVAFSMHFTESMLAYIHFEIRVDPKKPVSYDEDALEQQLIDIGRSWYDGLRESLIAYFGEERGSQLIHRYMRAFPAGYRETFLPRHAVYDIEFIEKLKNEKDLEMSFYRSKDAASSNIQFKLFHLSTTVNLSDALPILENMGLRVIGEQPYEINLQDGSCVWINDFTMEYPAGGELNVDANKDFFQAAFYKTWRGEAENDGFNRLVLKAHLDWRDVAMLRAYAKYLRQVSFTFSQQYIEETLSTNPNVAILLVQLFHYLFNPECQPDKEKNLVVLEQALKKSLDAVVALDQDRILRRFVDVLRATMRTNFFQRNEAGHHKPYISFKLEPKNIPELPLPLPMYEIFVYSPTFEGVHLRAGKVARGGIRWSDRREDFRTEVLGLMKAQQVKNAVIVPAGAKGGFVIKNMPANPTREIATDYAISAYKKFICGLLDITDNLVGNEIVAPPDTYCCDEADPYLVVAADKGTASFSDIANGISKDYNFWLGDAFASGGSTGYDHKKMGITSRGAWESVTHHFQILNIDILNHAFTVVGIGDMSGDVFGNGLLMSPNMKLIAAFNGIHIFIDPNPDLTKSYEERKRLFNLPRSGWDDYNRELLSKGGNIFNRSLKSIELSPEAQAALNFPQALVEPNALITAILKAPVDLIWNGGIGTYVKGSEETNLEVGDRANDAIRINGKDLRCKVVGEGGNLGWTQLARIEYALQNGQINTDFIDNSGGVDCSDHEVNIKILLDDVVKKGNMTEPQRNVLLAEMTEQVAKLVLLDNYRQVRAITLATNQSFEYLSLYIRYINDQEQAGRINRQLEFLPDNKTLLERKTAGKGLTRPEIAVLLSYSKIILKEEILKSDLINDSYVAKYVAFAFPQRLREQYADAMKQHRLYKEIIATQLSNALVNDMGIAFVYQLSDETGASVVTIVRAYIIMHEVFAMAEVRRNIDALEEVTHDTPELATNFAMVADYVRLIRRATRWLLRNRRPPYDIATTIDYFAKVMPTISKRLPELLIGTEKEFYDAHLQKLLAHHAPEALAREVAGARYIYSALNIIDLATQHQAELQDVATIYFMLADRLELVWFREKINAYPVDNHWTVLARASFKNDLDIQQRALTLSVLQHKTKVKNVAVRINTWMEQHQVLLERWQAVITELRANTVVEATMLAVAIRELSDLASMSANGAQN
jgi:glutamate dehydrogenase